MNHLDEHADTQLLAARAEEPEPARIWLRALVAGVSVFVLGGLGPGLFITLTSSPLSRPPTAAAAILPPVSNECTLQVAFDSDGNVSPLMCAGGGSKPSR